MTAGPRLLVVFATRHGSTAEIAAAVARAAEGSPAGQGVGLSAVPLAAERDADPAGYDGVVVGSAVYAGRWLDAATTYVAAHAGALRARPVWLFSSGPIGQPPFPPDEPYDAASLRALTAAVDHRVFPGRLEPSLLSFGERAMATAMRAPVGDFRDWPVVRAWGEEIATALADGRTPTTVPGRAADIDPSG